ncbi:rhomboid family intramembrane serine protease, partial [Paramuribaculum intestinale]
MAVIELIRNRAPRWSALTWIIIACAAVFVIVRIAAATGASAAGGSMAQTLVDRLALSSDAAALMSRPWTPFTYMFTHYEVMHLIFNMLWLYWFGTLLLTVFSGTRLMAVYLTGGLAGAAT